MSNNNDRALKIICALVTDNIFLDCESESYHTIVSYIIDFSNRYSIDMDAYKIVNAMIKFKYINLNSYYNNVGYYSKYPASEIKAFK